ncbi:sensor histidine kinase YesM [Parabacteroides sp. PF5-5]|uniref:sensor histidine kinase n=1 Tax=unclassified Parabacteroides TaxID=2649774 RepID=UPI0024764EB8|nr:MULTISPECIES: histidine kinase [unclassified Parabacteroides]MDH6304870.1 sensor histidine kinase YesM [Parabacteroides sp. PH5-39]MDH6316044.1 sensor histidine kinase YesM [Parabacteroides sp. PF5-13]MDH6319701.1 sensor histidine kinase YesM [Parabacteroides sp. PH5-13]MDH6323432.1 sensor histidine kinase YesM [Parabacteroides sp. PH5-8]MDH6327060.1 sensor histidine kinase YesM [Parabacteroides sp. PH5-41]
MNESDMMREENISTTVTSPPKRLGWLIHVIPWGLLLLFPFLFAGRNSDNVSWFDYLRFVTMFAGIIIVFYANYSYLVKRFLFSRQMTWYVVSNFLLFTVLIVLSHLITEQIPASEGRGPGPQHEFTWKHHLVFTLFDYVKYIFIAALSVALRMTSSWYKTEAERKELVQSRSEAELQNLKSQLNPHFLFNTLNNIYSLIAFSPDRAQEAVHELSTLLRYMLYESSQPTVTVGKDLDFIRDYVELMRIRLPQHVELKTEIQTTSPETPIAPLLFISLVENAFKHGVSNNKPSFIHIEIAADSKEVFCSIRNSYFPKNEQDKSGSGIGLVNLRKRLNLIYPGMYSFTYGQEEDHYTCKLELKLS